MKAFIKSNLKWIIPTIIAGVSSFIAYKATIEKNAIKSYIDADRLIRADAYIKERRKLDSTDFVFKGNILDSITDLKKNVRAMKGSVTSLASKVAATPAEFIKIMEGRTFEIVQDEPMKSIFPSPKIRWKQIPKDSVK